MGSPFNKTRELEGYLRILEISLPTNKKGVEVLKPPSLWHKSSGRNVQEKNAEQKDEYSKTCAFVQVSGGYK